VRVEPDGAIPLGLVYVHGLRKEAGQGMAAFDRTQSSAPPRRTYFCNVCSHEWRVVLEPAGWFTSIEQMVQRTGLRRDELALRGVLRVADLPTAKDGRRVRVSASATRNPLNSREEHHWR
jgi:hypothetical protein